MTHDKTEIHAFFVRYALLLSALAFLIICVHHDVWAIDQLLAV